MTTARHLKGIIAAGAVCAAGATMGGLALAQASSRPAAAARSHQLCVTYDNDDTSAACFGLGPRGFRGKRGIRGRNGPTGATGATGPVGLKGPMGLQGPIGDTGQEGTDGDQGIQGVQGATGAFGDGSGGYTGHTVVVLGQKDFLPSSGGPMTGTDIQPPVVARCPPGDTQHPEAYDGGVTVNTSGTHDVVTLESSFPGIYVSTTEVDPLPTGSKPGAVSSQSANAYEAQPVITRLDTSDTVTVQAYVVCGP
jgi:hypothetical protein